MNSRLVVWCRPTGHLGADAVALPVGAGGELALQSRRPSAGLRGSTSFGNPESGSS